ncbi:hypothetical protein KGF56_001010 [Candida oxycetoniae]|uniref:T6SS Phospholipase effector Tle1-like catalytic domain-containing protein n=1 Tax=Candida oxycetoniae TaxID=497107 RepID=A0AAI9SZR9_9ASCO|nr:uncharacterized protein KGF56_001010 [Candida oxycetoniae]KAI3406168.2 hypothetical protein KGF56_001010 [Candida oxycetoniae]
MMYSRLSFTAFVVSATLANPIVKCPFPETLGLVAVAKDGANAGWAMSPDEPCVPGKYCPYACPPGQLMNQWDPSATTYSYPSSMNGGFFCNPDGSLTKPFTDRDLCIDGEGTVSVVNQADKEVAFCQTVLPGNEAMLIPTKVDAGNEQVLAVPNPSYYAGTGAHYYINPPGVSTEEGCVWGTADKEIGNWSPYIAGMNMDNEANTYVTIGVNPKHIDDFNGKTPSFGVRIVCDNPDECNGLPCEINPKNGYNKASGVSAGNSLNADYYGTDNEFGPKPFTNVLKFFQMLEKNNTNQICYYQSGIGSSFKAESSNIKEENFLSSRYDKLNSKIDAMVAFTLKKHVLDAYEFLVKFFSKNDKIYIFGFSRGSFTARIVAGMIELVGLVYTGSTDAISMAWDIYNNWEQAGQPYSENMTFTMAQEFKQTFSRSDVEIHFMGLWDTINSVGFLWDRMFPFTVRSCNVNHIRHAVSIDERRSKYKQQLFAPEKETCFEDEDAECSTCNSRTTQTSLISLNSIGDIIRHLIGKKPESARKPRHHDDLVEVFFPGDHADIGGGRENYYGEWKRVFTPNMGQCRVIPENCVVHWSLFYRLHYIRDYNPPNIHSLSFSDLFLQSMLEFKQFTFNELQEYASQLTFHKIKDDWNCDIWKKIPDELSDALNDNPDL